jgi:hypothetical protein
MIKQFTLLICALIISYHGFSQQKTYYHTYRTSDSHIILTSWRVDFNQKGNKYIIETVDSNGRVFELRIMLNHELYHSDCYDNAITKFEYLKDTIIQYNLDNDSTYCSGIECGSPAKTLYILKNGKIIKCMDFLDYDQYLNGKITLEPEFKKQLEIDKEKNKNGIESNCDFIDGYIFSSAKYSGFLPVSNKFDSLEEFYEYEYSDSANNSAFSIKNSIHFHE